MDTLIIYCVVHATVLLLLQLLLLLWLLLVMGGLNIFMPYIISNNVFHWRWQQVIHFLKTDIIVISYLAECNIIFIAGWKLYCMRWRAKGNIIFPSAIKMILYNAKCDIYCIIYTSCAISDPIGQSIYHQYQI